MAERKRFVTTIDSEISLNFKVACTRQQKDMNEVLEVLMEAFSDGILNLEELSDEE